MTDFFYIHVQGGKGREQENEFVPLASWIVGLVTGNGAGVPGRENGVGGHARGPVRVRRSGLRDRDPGIEREARDRGQGRVTGPKGRTGRADVTEEMTGMLNEVMTKEYKYVY